MEWPAPPSGRDSLAGDSTEERSSDAGRKRDEAARQLATLPGVSVTISTALIAGIGKGGDFRTWSRLCGMAGLGPASIDDRRQGPPACDAMDRRDRAFSTEWARNALYLLVSLPGAPGENLWIRPSVRACGTGFPVRQRWRSTADLRRLFPRNAIENWPRSQAIARLSRNGLPHGKRPCACCLESFFTGDLGIPERVRLLRIGLTGRRETCAS